MNFLEDIVVLHKDSLESQHIDFNMVLIGYNSMPRQKAGDEMAIAGRTVAPTKMRPRSNTWGLWKPPYLKTVFVVIILTWALRMGSSSFKQVSCNTNDQGPYTEKTQPKRLRKDAE